MAKDPLRYKGDETKLRGGGVYVRAEGITQDDVVLAVKRFWASTKAAEEEPGDAGISGADFKRHGLLGVAILPAAPDADGSDWIGVYDTAPYSHEEWLDDLCRALNAYLAVPVFSFYIGPKTRLASHGESGYAGLARKPTRTWDKTLRAVDRFPYPFFAPADPVEGVVWLRFRIASDVLLRKLEFEKEFWR
ncbi:MAG: hypothetical protein FWD73_04225 [Polyangiaceae bacterium]|nr:hypothetical protein [Polyangiaceae bacterium]